MGAQAIESPSGEFEWQKPSRYLRNPLLAAVRTFCIEENIA